MAQIALVMSSNENNADNKKAKQGGKRKGAGRKANTYKTKTIAFRVRVEWMEEIKRLVKCKVTELNNTHEKM